MVLDTLLGGTTKTVTEIVELRIYPIKSCRGIKVSSSHLGQSGLDLDRRWMIADAETCKFVTIRDVSRMTLIDTEIGAATEDKWEELIISTQDPSQQVRVPSRPTEKWLSENTSLETVTIWGTETDGYIYRDEVNSIFCKLLERKVVLVYKGPSLRPLRGNGAPHLLGRQGNVNFPDILPVQIANEASLRELNKRLKSKDEEEITIERFRPNIIVKGADETADGATRPQAWEEDRWKTVRVIFEEKNGLASYFTTNSLDVDVVARCARCQVPNVDPDTAYKNPKEPWNTLVSYRRVDEGIKYKPCFGMLCVPRSAGKIAVGMRFEVVETTNDHKYATGF